MSIELYDLATADPKLRFSPYCWRVKMALAHKALAWREIACHFTDKDRLPQSSAGTVPVLVDDGYVGKGGIHGFPTTWFVDRGGHIVFTKLGSTEKLAEEFGWRVEALKEKTGK